MSKNQIQRIYSLRPRQVVPPYEETPEQILQRLQVCQVCLSYKFIIKNQRSLGSYCVFEMECPRSKPALQGNSSPSSFPATSYFESIEFMLPKCSYSSLVPYTEGRKLAEISPSGL